MYVYKQYQINSGIHNNLLRETTNKNDKPLVIIYKIILFIFPMFLIELWAEKRQI